MAGRTAGWRELSQYYYAEEELYELEWDRDLDDYMVAAAPFGGPIALVRDDTKAVAVAGGGDLRPIVYVYTSSGHRLTSFVWEHLAKLVKMGWTNDERLICVRGDGHVFIYTLFGVLQEEYTVAPYVEEKGVYDCIIWETGLVVMTTDWALFSVDFANREKKRLAELDIFEAPASWTVVEPRFTLSGTVDVLVATQSGTILVADAATCQDQLLTEGPFTRMAVSPNGKLLALFTSAGSMMVVATDFSRNLSELNTNSTSPIQLAWCGSDSVVMSWSNLLVMVGPYSAWNNYHLDEVVHLVSELDGVRVLSGSKCTLIQRVPAEVQDIFGVGATSPSALLFDAFEFFEAESPRADEIVRAIKGELAEAVEGCVAAAGRVFSRADQKALLRAASFGKLSLDYHDPASFVDMCRTLRVLNAVRQFNVGMPLTYIQYEAMGADVLVARLINRHHHLLALRICEYLDLPSQSVLVHWAIAKVRTPEPDETVCDMIVGKLSTIPGISYVEVAEEAHKTGRKVLATLLLDYEPRAAVQVPLLLSMGEYEVALTKAIDSGDTDLVYLALLSIQNNFPLGDFFNMIHGKPFAQDLLIVYARTQDVELLKDFYYNLDMPNESANLMVREAYKSADLPQRENLLRHAIEDYTEHRDRPFEAKMTEEQCVLLRFQRELQGSTGEAFIDLSVSETLFRAILLGEVKTATKIRNEFKVPDKRFWWVKIKALAEAGNWDGLEKFAKEKKSPVGFEPFVEACLEHRNNHEAAKYIPRVSDPEARALLYARVGDYKEAADAANQAKNGELLVMILNKTNDPRLRSSINTMLAKL